MRVVYRVQDENGRGPWRPGFSKLWVDLDKPESEVLPPFYEEVGQVLHRAREGMNLGCACESPEQLRRWFNRVEYERLLAMGYAAVRMTADGVLAESKNQLVIERRRPFRFGVESFDLYAIEVSR